ncbi:soma ferritin-like [Centruroides sculpturatus]|uniref:soma ferritin-like n=1 Tax=Centruroides sculpturatus TaxID=218467 RepID=UPI000C6DE1DC|nr:soma ferritin-like [Centruroides sculpturatus]
MAEIRIGVQQKIPKSTDQTANKDADRSSEWKKDGSLENSGKDSENNQRKESNCLVRQNFPKECEDAINRQINEELFARYTYSSMAYYFQRDDVALAGCFKFFKQCSDEEQEHAEKFMKYLNDRGGRIELRDVKKPEKNEWGSMVEAMSEALKLEKRVNRSLLDIHKVASQCGDAQTCNFLESEFLPQQVEDIKKLADYISSLNRVGKGLGEYIFDKETLGGK